MVRLLHTTQAVAVAAGVATGAPGALVPRSEGRHVGDVDCEVVADQEGGIVDATSAREGEPGTLEGSAAYGCHIPPHCLGMGRWSS